VSSRIDGYVTLRYVTLWLLAILGGSWDSAESSRIFSDREMTADTRDVIWFDTTRRDSGGCTVVLFGSVAACSHVALCVGKVGIH